MKLKTYLTAGTLAFGLPMAAQAALQFDTQGNGSFLSQPGDVITIDAFDWAQNSFLAQGGTEATLNYILSGGTCPDSSCDFQVYTHGVLNSATLDGDPVWGGKTFGDNQVEVTFTLSFTETVTSATLDPNSVSLATVVPGSVTFEMYYDETPDAAALTGSGYTDGTLILFGDAILDSTGNFEITSAVDDNGAFITEDLDQSGDGNDFTGQLTVAGNGINGNLDIGGLVQDDNYFLSTLADFGFAFSNVSQDLPFISVNPSDCFSTGSNGAGGANVGTVIGANGCDTNHVDGLFENNEGGPGYTPVTGTVNGFTQSGVYKGDPCITPGDGLGGLVQICPDFVAQTDTNSPITTEEVPAPGTLAITGLGLLLLGARRRRNKA